MTINVQEIIKKQEKIYEIQKALINDLGWHYFSKNHIISNNGKFVNVYLEDGSFDLAEIFVKEYREALQVKFFSVAHDTQLFSVIAWKEIP